MTEAFNRGELNEYDMTNIIEYTNKLVDYIVKDENVRKEVTSVMGGTVLETYADKHLKDGLDEQAKKFALYLISDGKSNIEINKVTNLSEEEIEKLRQN